MIRSSTSATRPDQYRSPSWSPASWARRAFSPREAWKIEIDFDKRQGQVEEQRALPRLAAGAGAQFPLPLRGGLRLGGQQARVGLGGLVVVAGRTAYGRAVGSFPLAEEQVVGLALDRLARGEAERLRGGAPPAAGRLAALLARVDVVGGRVHRQGRVDLLPDVVKVVALAQRADNCQRLPPPREASGTDHEHQMVHGCDGSGGHKLRMTKRPMSCSTVPGQGIQ